jgi:hypothetical protein
MTKPQTTRVKLGQLRGYPRDLVPQLRNVLRGESNEVVVTQPNGEVVRLRAIPLRVDGNRLVERK